MRGLRYFLLFLVLAFSFTCVFLDTKPLTLFILFLIPCTLIAMLMVAKPPYTILSHWQHFFEGTTLAPGDFYALIAKGIQTREIKVKVDKEAFLEKHILSSKREYLRIREGDHVYYICAAPFGTGTFVSWRLCEYDERLIGKIPVLNKLFGKDRKNKTFYQTDTEAMYKSAIHGTVLAAIDEIGTEKGLRSLSDYERQYREGNK